MYIFQWWISEVVRWLVGRPLGVFITLYISTYNLIFIGTYGIIYYVVCRYINS